MDTSHISPFLLLATCILASCDTDTTDQQPSQPLSNPPAKTIKLTPKAPEGMIYLAGGTYTRGSKGKQDNEKIYREETPAHKTTVGPFFIDVTEVTNAQFKQFVDATGYKTLAERGLSKKDFPQAPPEMLVPGAGVFKHSNQKIDPHRHNPMTWWPFVPGANWKHPQGPDSSIEDKMDHPVVCINHYDAEAYAKWAGKRLPTEAEWEFAARGGLEEKKYAWGDVRIPEGKWMGNFYQGSFPHQNTKDDGYEQTAPVKSFPPNNYGLYDMSGNVWEMCSEYYDPTYYSQFNGKTADNPKGPKSGYTSAEISQWSNFQPLRRPPVNTPELLLVRTSRGGSFLCHIDYCLRYRPAARHYSEPITPTNHTGFRCVKDITTK